MGAPKVRFSARSCSSYLLILESQLEAALDSGNFSESIDLIEKLLDGHMSCSIEPRWRALIRWISLRVNEAGLHVAATHVHGLIDWYERERRTLRGISLNGDMQRVREAET